MNILRHFAQSIILSAFLSLGILSTPIANAQSTDVSCMLFSPITDDCDGSGTPISVQITNEDMVNIAPAGLMVSVTIDGSTFLNQATPTPLNPGEFTLLDFGPLDVLPGKHSINASVTMPGDLNPGNDMSFSTFDIAFNGLYTVGGGGDFSTLKQVVDTINAYGICGATTITLAAGHTEISSNIVLQTSSTNSVNTLTFIAADINDPPIITAGTGTGTLDGIFIIGGTDYVTLNGIAFMENPTNITPTTMMEWGIALLKESGTNGTQYCTITNCGIQLNKANNQSFGIYGANHTASSSATLTVTSIDGTNSYNDINTCLITNVYNGIKLFGYLASSPYTFYDQGNLIGKNGKVRITNFGGQVFDAAGIYCAYQNDLMISNDSIAGGDGTSGGILYGVNVGTSNNATITINSNYINVGNASTQVYGINTTSNATTGSNVLTINNNYITGLSTTSGNIYGIYSSSTPDSTSISYNTIENVSTTSTGTFYGISTGSPRASGVIADTIRNITKDASGNCYAINIGTTRIFAVDNVIDNIQKTPSYSGGVYGLYSYYADELEVFSNNKITNLSGGTTALYGIYTYTYSTSNKIINGNIISDLETSSGSVYGIYQSSGNANISSNKISSLTQTSGSNYVYGMYISTSDYINIYNNYVSELYNLTASGSNAVNGLYVNGGSLVSVLNNTVYLDASSVGVNFGTSGIYANTSPTVDMRNNLIVNNSTPAGSGITVAYRRSGTTLTSYSSVSNNNCLYAGTPGAANLIYYDGTNSDQIIDAFKTRMATRDQASVSELPPFADVSVSPYDLHLTGLIPTPMCESGGIPVTTPVAITTDYDGEVRNISTPDIGADEGDFDITAPTVAFVPADGLTDVPVSTTVMVTFDENVRKADNTTLDNSNIASVLSLTKTDLSAVAFTATWNAGSNTAIITPDAVLEPMTDYIAAATGVEDMSNNYLSGDTSATFTTGAADLTPPDVDSAIVYNGNPDQIVIYYNEPIKLVDLTGFSATVNAAPETFSGFSGSMTSTLVITLDNPVVSHDVVLVSYNDATGNVTDITGNPFASVTDAVIENRVISSEKDILTFDFTTPAMNVVFQGTNIFAMFPPATDVSALTAVFTISDYANATIAAAPQTSGVTVNDFSNPVTYTIEAEDGTTQDYLVVVNIAYPIPYSENFDVDEGNWTASGTSSNWVHGTPSKTQISAAYSTPNCWVTNLSSDYSSSQNSYLETPLFDATSLVGDLIIEFAHNFDMESGWDAGVLEYSINGGQFVRVDSLVGTGGTFDTPTSSFWYNSSSSNGPISARKWSGVSTAYTGHANGWITSSTLLDNVAGSYVSFRFHFGSDVTGVAEGWAVDDFTLREQSDEKELLTFGFASPAVTGVFSDTNVTVTVPADTDPSALVAEFTSSAFSTVMVGTTTQVSGVTPNDFTAPVVYEVFAENGTSQEYLITLQYEAPEIVFDPADAETDVPVNQNITITFSAPVRNIDDSEIDDANVDGLVVLKLDDGNGAAVPFDATINITKDVITINPMTDLDYNQDYFVKIGAVVEGIHDNAITADSATFTTLGAPDLLGPEVTSAVVENAAPLDIVITFDENVNFTDETGFSVLVDGSPATISGIAGTLNTITLTLSQPILSHQVVAFSYDSISGNVTDASPDLNEMSDVSDYAVVNNVISSEKDMLTFDFTTPASQVTIGGSNIYAAMPPGSDISALTAVFTISDYATPYIGVVEQTSGVTVNDFSSVVTYTIEAEDGTTKDYNVITFVAYSIPYAENFDTDDGNWTASGTASNWVHGTPAKTQIAAAYSAPDCWITNLSGNYASSQNSYLETPVFNATTLTGNLVVEFAHNFALEEDYDAGVLEYSLNGGPFMRVDSTLGTGGTFNTALSTNWYNNNTTYGPIDYNKWSNLSTDYTGNANGWINSKTILSAAAGNFIAFRFHFGSDISGTDEGWAVDNFILRTQSSENELLTFGFASPSVSGVINDTNVTVIVPPDTDPAALIAEFTTSTYSTVNISGTPQVSGVTPNDFSTAVVYTVVAEDGTEQEYLVTLQWELPEVVFDPADAETGVAVNQNVTLTFNAPIRNIDDSEIDDTNVDGLVVLKLDDGNGAAVPFDATISVDKTVITIDPTSDFDYNQDYFVKIGAVVEANYNNAILPDSATFTTLSDPDTLGPEVTAALVENAAPSNIVITLDENALFTDETGFSVEIGGTPATVTGIAGATNSLTISIAETILSHQVVTFSYDSISGNITDASPGINPMSDVVDYPVVNNVLSSENDLLTYDFVPAADTILVNGNNLIAFVAVGTDVTALVSVFTVSDYAELFVGTTPQVSGVTTNNFTTPVVYTVEAEDGSTQDYTVTVRFWYNLPYTQDFEGIDDWTTNAPTTDWVKGTPAKIQIVGAHSGANAYITNLSTVYTTSRTSTLTSPYFNAMNLSTSPKLTFFSNFKTEEDWDAGVVEISLNDGPWVRLDSVLGTGPDFATPNSYNWYNADNIDGPIDGPKFTGSSTNYGTAANGWIQSKTNLVAGKYFRIRFKFSSDSSTNDEGWAVDDINISLPAANDVGVIAILAPVDGCGHTNADTVTIQVVNFGTDAQTDIPVGYSLDGGTTIVSESISGTLNPGDTVQYTFTTPADLTAAGSYDMGATTFLTSDADASNDLTTLMLNVIGEISSFPYIENFEDNMAEYFNIEEDTYSNTYFRTQGANTMFVMEGGSANTNWTGTGGSITYNNAWVATTEHQAGAYTCDIDASSVTDLALKLDIKQNNTYGYTDYSWFRVLANGTVIHDVNGDSTFKANVSTGEPFHTLQFDLSGFAGTQFVLRMESSCKYNSDYDGSYPEGDNVILDNIILYVPAGNDVGVSSVINPVSSLCGDLQDSLLVIVSNFGTTDVSDIPVEADVTKPDLSVQHLSGTYAGPLVAGASDTLYMGTINTTATGDYLVTAYTALDQDTTHYNDTTHAIFNVLPPLALPYTEDFEGTVDGWASNMALSSGHGNTSTVLYDNMWSSNTEVYALSPKVGEIQAGDMLSFEYRITNYTGGGATTLNGDTLLVGIYDCDAMYLGHMITQANHTPSTEMQLVTVDLTPFAGSNIQVYFDMIWGAGDYYIDIDNINIMTPMAPVVEIGNDTTICDGQLLALDAGNQPYSSIIWQQNGLAGDTISTAQTANITESGLYVVSVENAYGLTTIDSLTVTVNALPVVDIGSDVSLCENDTTTLDGGTFANYFWLDASNGDTLAVTQTYDAAATGDYILAASDIYGCENTDTVTVTVNPPPAIDLGNDTVLCTATSITLDAGAGMTYLWSDNTMNQTVVLTASDTISVIIFDTVTTCSNSDMIVVIFSPAITVDLGSDTTICADYVVTLDGGTHDSYLWTEQISGDTVGAAATYDVIQTGTYILEATNSLGCSKTDTVAITVNALPIVNLGNDTALCVAGSLILDAGAGFNYLWDDSSTNQTLTVSTDDTASVVITDPGTGCTNSDEIIVLFNPIVDVNLGADTITVCGNVLLDAGYFVNASYIWTETASTDTIGNIQTFDAAMAGTYIVEVTNTCGSSDLDSVTVNINALPTATISADPLVCAGSMDTLYISFTGQGPWDILVSANATTVPVNNIATSPFSTVLTPGAATTITILSVTDAYGCTATNTDTFLINVNPLPVVELGANPTSCDVDTITLDAGTNGVTYEWSVGGLTTQVVNLTVADLGIGAQGVGVTVTDVNGCENSDFVLATFVATPVFSLGSDEVACETEIVHLDASAISGSYLWMPGNYTTATVDYDVNDLGIGTSVVSLTVTTNGCAAQDSVQITFNSSPVVYLGPDTTICDYSAITLDAENPGSTYVWSVAGETAQTLVVDTSVAVYGPNTISVVVTNTDACSATDNVVVTIDNCVGVSETTASDMFNYYPNPVNDVLRIELGQKYQDASVSILDAQGKLVYSEVVSGTSNIQVEVKSLAAGVYTLRVIVADQVHTGLISVE